MDTANPPVLGPLLALLRSRKVIVSIVVFLVSLLVQQAPALAPIAGTLTSILAIVGVAVIGGISLEDSAKYVATRGYGTVTPTVPVLTPEENLRQVMNDVIDERVHPGALLPDSPVVVAPPDDTVIDGTAFKGSN